MSSLTIDVRHIRWRRIFVIHDRTISKPPHYISIPRPSVLRNTWVFRHDVLRKSRIHFWLRSRSVSKLCRSSGPLRVISKTSANEGWKTCLILIIRFPSGSGEHFRPTKKKNNRRFVENHVPRTLVKTYTQTAKKKENIH